MSSGVQVRLTGIHKSFPGVRALRGVDMEVRPGEVHLLAGENGSGKSTLMRILAGATRPDRGRIHLSGEPTSFRRVSDAWDRGIALVSQELSLAPHLSVAENIFLGHRQTRRSWGIAWRDTARRAEVVLNQLGASIDPRLRAGDLPIDQQQLVEIARAISSAASVLILDEPTSSLNPQEVTRLFDVIRSLTRQGMAVAFITHRLSEMLAVGDRFTVLRDGLDVAHALRRDVDENWLVRNMVGRELDELAQRRHDPSVGPEFKVVGLTDRQGRFANVSFSVDAGEIVGLAGLAGAGRTEMLETIVGVRSRRAGRVSVAGTVVGESPRAAREAGVVLVPDDRRAKALVLPMSVSENLLLTETPWPLRFNNRSAHSGLVETWRQRLSIRLPSSQTPISLLSGGNQQKVIVARAMRDRPRVLLMDEPTRGVDIGAKADIYELVVQFAAAGSAVVVASSEIPELLLLCHRILVFHHGTVNAELTGDTATEEQVVAAATGSSRLVATGHV